ncbi:GMC oxidoreductase [Athelia psychrophila]|uniref:GMC oxidoreductase n=1 Tax=Athelia psychrophila TaxID=1759441 RepID=A0A167XG92_9AGAM|nr:GMC oxidoreductase [Fibularhizoctonia sp. CBS 109695]
MLTKILLALLSSSIAVRGLAITSDPASVAGETYTHVIVGGGTAGLTVASRLAEDPRFHILVIETGPDEQNNTIINDPDQVTAAATTFSYFFATTPQDVNGKSLIIPQGRVLGGSSSINGMQWTRGTTGQYNTFEQLGSAGWNAQSLFKYMKKSEHFNVPNAYQASLGATSAPAVHGTSGPVSVSYPQPYLGTVSFGSYISSLLKFFKSTRLSQIPDACTGSPHGAVRFFYSLIPGASKDDSGGNRRCSSAVAYVYPYANGAHAGQKSSLTVLVGALATGVVWGNASQGLQVASGVSYAAAPASPAPPANTTLGTIYQVKASKEVIVCAGALGSPHFLELSGIGDPKVLAAASVPVKVSLPQVGTNLQDQPLITNIYTINPANPPAWTNVTNEVTEGAVGFLSLTDALGAQNAHTAGQQLLATVRQRAQAIVQKGGHTSVAGLSKQLQAQAESMLDPNNPAPVTEMSFATDAGGQSAALQVWNLLPQSRGTVHISSNNPAALSSVNPMYLTEPFDIFLSANATKAARGVMNTPPVSQLLLNETSPGYVVVPANATDAQWQAFIKADVTPTIHPVGSVAMGAKDEGGCVDSNLVVYGTKNVRVADSSVIPIEISAHLSGTVYGIAEKVADIIKASS